MQNWILELIGAESWAVPWVQEGMICVQDLEREILPAFELKDISRRPRRLDALGCGGWDAKGILRQIHLDFDVGHGSGKNSKYSFATTDDAIAAARRVRELLNGAAEIRYSKSGVGIHVRGAVAGELINGREARKSLGIAAYAAKWIGRTLGIPIDPTVNGRQNLWFWAAKTGALGFKLIEPCLGKWEVPDGARRPDSNNTQNDGPQAGGDAANPIFADVSGEPHRPGQPGNGADRAAQMSERAGGTHSRREANASLEKNGLLSDFERAALYIKKTPPVSEGGRNAGLFATCADILKVFPLQYGEIEQLGLAWAAGCAPPMQIEEARETIRSAYTASKARGEFGSKWTPPKIKGQGRPISEPGGAETQIEIPDGLEPGQSPSARSNQTADCSLAPMIQAPAQETASEASSSNSVTAPAPVDDAELPPASEGEDTAADSSFAGDIDEVDRDRAKQFFEHEFETELYAAVHHSPGLKRDGMVIALFAKLARHFPAMETVTKARVKDLLCTGLRMSRGDFNLALGEARVAIASGESKGSTDDADFVKLARAFLRGLRPDQDLLRWRQEWYHWQRSTGVYSIRSEEWLEALCGRWMIKVRIPITETAYRNLRHVLKVETFLDDDITPGQWITRAGTEGICVSDHAPGVYFAMGNGILDLEHPERPLAAHTPDYWTINGVSYAYDPKAACPQFEEALYKWQGEASGETLAIQLLQDWAGYCLDPGNREQKFLLCKGEGNDAKSTYAHILKAIVGEKNVGALGLEAFDPKKQFGLWPLLGKTLNITGDASHVDRISEGIIKSITGGDTVTIDRKNLKPITAVLDCKFVMNCNRMPMFQDQSEGIWRRMLVLDWRTIDEKDVIRDYHQILIRAEISGIFNWALAGFHRVRGRGFQRQGVLQTSLDAARASIQPEINFFEESIDYEAGLEESKQSKTYSESLVAAYHDYCRRHNVTTFLYEDRLGHALRKWLTKRLLAAGGEAAAVKKTMQELRRRDSKEAVDTRKRKTFYQGVRIRTDIDEAAGPVQPMRAQSLFTPSR